MKVWRALVFVALCAWALGASGKKAVVAADDEQELLSVDSAAFAPKASAHDSPKNI